MATVLSSVSDTECSKLCHGVVDGLCGGRTQLHSKPQESQGLLSFLTAVFHQAVRENLSEEQVLAQVSEAGVTNSHIMLDVLRSRKAEIRHALLDRTLAISSATLQDFDWQLKYALSSDRISSVNTPLLSLSLDLRENRGLRPVSVELNRKELDVFITSLENANKVLLQLKGCDPSS